MNKKIILLLIVCNIGCASVDLNMNSINVPILMDSNDIQESEKFEIKETFWYWANIKLYPNHNIQDLLKAQLALRNDVKSIRSFQIIVYNNYEDSPQFSLMNPTIFIWSFLSINIMNGFLFTKKSIMIKGEYIR